MKNKNILTKLYLYQKERFPLAVLFFTTLSVVLSSAAIVYQNDFSFSIHWIGIVLAFSAAIIFMFNVRVLDEIKDYEFDFKHHPERPVQRGLISLKSLFVVNFIFLVILFIISIYSSLLAFLFLLIALIYSLIAGFDFFLGRRIRKRFFLYNILCLLQLLMFQVHLYLILTPKLDFLDSLLYIHFFFVLVNAGVIEVGRKIKVKSNESSGKDTYSSRMGKKKAIFLFLGIILLSYISFAYIFFSISSFNYLFLISLFILILQMISLIFYIISDKNMAEIFMAGIGILFYLSLHIILFFGGIN